MEDQSLLSEAITKNQSGEISDSNSSSHHQSPINHPTNSSTVLSSKFKGVVSQPNGHWGAQIYANHQRIWLGTFKSEKEAAMAYDSAAIRLRNGHSQRNFAWTNVTVQEPNFQSHFSTEAVLAMIKDSSYAARFSDFLRSHEQLGSHLSALPSFQLGVKLRQLFQKELTPSDVGKLNRLVIPKRYAIKYLPGVPEVNKKYNKDSYDLELIFYDRLMRSWKFRYCYWKSSQSFVFTRGWSAFAKEQGLRPHDKVIFSAYQRGNQRIYMIDVAYHDGARNSGVVVMDEGEHEASRARQSGSSSKGNLEQEVNDTNMDADGELKLNMAMPEEGFKLFGVQIA